MRKKIAAILAVAALVFNSCAMVDSLKEDVSVTLQPPNTITVMNNSYVSTLDHFKVEIFRQGDRVYTLEKDCDIPSGDSASWTAGGFEIQNGDAAKIGDLKLSWDM
jgi:hypothetical protein